MITIVNIILLCGLLILLIVEEMRFRAFAKHVSDTQSTLMNLSHQLRTPIATIRKFTVLLRAEHVGMLSVGQLEALCRLEHATSTLTTALNRLLAASKIEQDKLSMQPIEINLCDSVEAALHSLSALIDERKHDVEFTEKDTSIIAYVDPLLLHGILDELLLNAVSYTMPGGRITISITTEKDTVTIHIQDTGVGISDEEKQLIFDKFYRGKRARALAEGHGLGLSFAKLFADRMGGSLEFESHVDHGSIFSLTVPIGSQHRR